MGNAIARQDQQQLLGPGADHRFNDAEIRDEFNALVLPFRSRDGEQHLRDVTGNTIEGIRRWLRKESTANVTSLFNLAQHLPAVRDWVAQRCGIERAVQAKSYDVWLQGLYLVAAGNGPDAQKARWAINRLNTPDDEPARAEDNVVRDLFEPNRRAR